MSLKIDSNRNIETADQAEEILFQARLENKRAVVVQTDNGRAIRITKPNNILTQFFSDLSGQTQREQSQIREFVSSLRERDTKLINRTAQVLSSAEDDELDIVEEDVYQSEVVSAGPHHSDQKVEAKIKQKIKADHPVTISPLTYKISSKLAERARAEERSAEARAANEEDVEVEKKLLEDATTRKAEADKTYDAKGEIQQAQSLKNRESSVLQMQARENQER